MLPDLLCEAFFPLTIQIFQKLFQYIKNLIPTFILLKCTDL